MNIFAVTDEEIADATSNEIIDSIKTNNDEKIVDLFSNTIKNEKNLSQDATSFLNYVNGDVVSFTSVSEGGSRSIL